MTVRAQTDIPRPTPPALSGYLKKLKRNKSILGAWTERYIHVNIELERIENYKLKAQSVDPSYATSFIDLCDIVDVRPYDGTFFQIEAKSRVLYLKASSYAERACWVDGLTAFVEEKKNYELARGKCVMSENQPRRAPSDLNVLTGRILKKPEPPPLSSYLIKLKRNSSIISSWAERYFHVNVKLARIENYKLKAQSVDSSYATNFIDLNGILVVRRFNDISFQIETDSRVLLLKAKTPEDCGMWVDGLTAYVDDLKAYLNYSASGSGTMRLEQESVQSCIPSISSVESESPIEDSVEHKESCRVRTDFRGPERSRQSSKASYQDAEGERYINQDYRHEKADWATKGRNSHLDEHSFGDRDDAYDDWAKADPKLSRWSRPRSHGSCRKEEGAYYDDDDGDNDTIRPSHSNSRPVVRERYTKLSPRARNTSQDGTDDAYCHKTRPPYRRRSGSRIYDSEQDCADDDDYHYDEPPLERGRSWSRGHHVELDDDRSQLHKHSRDLS